MSLAGNKGPYTLMSSLLLASGITSCHILSFIEMGLKRCRHLGIKRVAGS